MSGQAETSAEAWFNIALRPRKPEGSLGRTAQDDHLDFHTVQLLNYVEKKKKKKRKEKKTRLLCMGHK